MKKLLLGSVAVATLGVVGSAFAADMPAYRAAPPPVVSDWTGPYIGIELGGKMADSTWTATSLRDPPGVLLGGISNPIDPTSPRTYNPSGFRAGGYLGYNWQVNSLWVVGLEADAAWTNKTQTAVDLPGCGGHFIAVGVYQGCVLGLFGAGVPGTDLASVELRWDASVRGRLGYLVAPNLLLYVTGGVAWQNVRSTGVCGPFLVSDYCNTAFGVAVGSQSITNSTTRTGGTVGGGLEGKLYGNWLLRGEYRYADFGNWNEVFAFTPTPAGSNTYRYRLELQTHIVTLGLAYKLY